MTKILWQAMHRDIETETDFPISQPTFDKLEAMAQAKACPTCPGYDRLVIGFELEVRPTWTARQAAARNQQYLYDSYIFPGPDYCVTIDGGKE